MTINQFKSLVIDYMNRAGVTFDVDSPTNVDKLLLAANNAKAYAQRKLVFERARCAVDLVIDKNVGGALSSAVLTGTTTPCRIMSIEQGYLPTTDGNHFPVDVVNRASQIKSLQRRTDGVYDPTRTRIPPQQRYPELVRFNDTIYLYAWDTNLYTTQTISVLMDVVQWMPEYGANITGVATTNTVNFVASGTTFIDSGVKAGDVIYNTTTGASAVISAVVSNTALTLPTAIFAIGNAFQIGLSAQEDFFLTDCIDWMLYKTVQELNLFLKEDQRVALSNKFMDDCWETVKSWNTKLIGTYDEIDLD